MSRHKSPRSPWWFAGLAVLLLSLPAGMHVDAAGPDDSAPRPAGAQEPEPAAEASGDRAEAQRQVVLYYLHGARRCKTCRSIEAYARGVVNGRFAGEVESGALSWQVVNYDQPENRHFVDDFGLFTSSLVVVEKSGAEMLRFEVLQEAWSLVRDKQRFQQYVYRALREHLD